MATLEACHRAGALHPLHPAVSIVPQALTLTAYVGATAQGGVAAANSGNAADTLTLSLAGDPSLRLETASPLEVGAGATLPILVRFTPGDAGSVSAVLTVIDSAGTSAVAVSAQGLADLACAANGPCDRAAFDADAGSCEHRTGADGESCTSPARCLVNTRCLAGACVGDPNPCDDHDACTTDSCAPADGCHHDDNSQRCIGSDPCHIYACDPATGCTDATAANGAPCALGVPCQTAEVCLSGQCTGLPVPDGEKCQLWWEPCASDSACHGGTCRSPTAEAEVPGQLRWDAGLGGQVLGPFTVNGQGTSTFLELPGEMQTHSALEAIDQCGQRLWSNTDEDLGGVLLDPEESTGQLIGWTAPDGQALVGLDPATGETTWRLDLASAAAPFLADAGFLLPVVNTYGAPAMSNQGLIYALLQVTEGDAGGDVPVGFPHPFLAGADRAGHLDWIVDLPVAVLSQPVVDAAGFAYLFEEAIDPDGVGVLRASPSGVVIEFLDPNVGAPSRSFWGPWGLAVGGDFLFVEGAGLALQLDGGIRFADPPLGAAPCASSAVIDAQGTITGLGLLDSGFLFGATAVDALGRERWSSTTAELSGAVLADDGTLFGTTADDSCVEHGLGAGPAISAVDGSGSTSWTTVAGPLSYKPTRLALTPGGSLLSAAGDQAFALFAGKVKPAANAPWSRAWGGDNRNRSCVPAP